MDKGRDNMILKNMKIVHSIVKKHLYKIDNNPSIDKDDLVSIGTIGLIKACDRFDDSYENKFITYATYIIEGEILNYLRKYADTVKFSRTAKEYFYRISKENLLEEEPETIAAKLNMCLKDVKNALDYYNNKMTASMDFKINKDGTTVEDLICEDEMDIDLKMDLDNFMSQLRDTEKDILKLRYQGLTQVGIGKLLGLTQVQVGRKLHKVASKYRSFELGIKSNKPDHKEAMKLAKETKLSGYAISKQTRVSHTTVYQYIREYREKEIA